MGGLPCFKLCNIFGQIKGGVELCLDFLPVGIISKAESLSLALDRVCFLARRPRCVARLLASDLVTQCLLQPGNTTITRHFAGRHVPALVKERCHIIQAGTGLVGPQRTNARQELVAFGIASGVLTPLRSDTAKANDGMHHRITVAIHHPARISRLAQCTLSVCHLSCSRRIAWGSIINRPWPTISTLHLLRRLISERTGELARQRQQVGHRRIETNHLHVLAFISGSQPLVMAV